MISAAQSTALKAFLDLRLVAFLTTEQIYRSKGDLPEAADPFLTYNPFINSSMGRPSEIPEFPGGVGPPQLVVRDIQEVSIEFQVGTTLGDSQTQSAQASRVLQALRMALYSSQKSFALRKTGLAPFRVGDVIDLGAIARGSQWESRASLTVVFTRTEVEIDTTTAIIDNLEVEGTADPVPGTVGPDVIGP